MTEKRFTLAYEKGNWWAVRDGEITLWKEEVITLLNDFYEENEQLKKDLKKKFVPFAEVDGDYTTVNTEEFIKILNENEQLKKQLGIVIKEKESWAFICDCSTQVMNDDDEIKEDYLKVATRELDRMNKENEQLKKRLIELDDLKWIREHTVWEQMPTRVKTYTKTGLNGGDVDD